MSQYGALGYAQHGWNAAQILGHYYTGTTLGTTDPNQQGPRPARSRRPSSARITRRAPGGLAQAATRRRPTRVKRRGADAGRPGCAAARASRRSPRRCRSPATGGVTTLGGHGRYRGVLEFKPGDVQRADGDQRRRARRVPAGRRARGVARLVAGRGAARPGDRRPHLRDHDGQERRLRPLRRTRARRSTRASGSRQPSTNAAVADTRGQIVTYQGQPVVTYFFSTSGGRTESVENTSLGQRAEAVAAVRRGRVRQRLAAPPLDARS